MHGRQALESTEVSQALHPERGARIGFTLRGDTIMACDVVEAVAGHQGSAKVGTGIDLNSRVRLPFTNGSAIAMLEMERSKPRLASSP